MNTRNFDSFIKEVEDCSSPNGNEKTQKRLKDNTNFEVCKTAYICELNKLKDGKCVRFSDRFKSNLQS